MKKTLTLALLSLFFVTAYAQNPYFAVKEGQVLTMAEKNPKGKITGYSTLTITKMEGNSTNGTVNYQTMVMDDKKKPLMATPMELSIQIVDGVVKFDPSSFAKISEGMEISGDSFLLPANASVGDTFNDYVITIAIGPIKTTTTISELKVEAQENFSVSGKEYSCLVVSSVNSTRIMGMTNKGLQKTWYAKGVGIVKTESYDKNNKLVLTTELVEIN